jgi:hypothetical protein
MRGHRLNNNKGGAVLGLTKNTLYRIKYCCRDSGRGLERGTGIYQYLGREGLDRKHVFSPVRDDAGKTVYLFYGELLSCEIT